MKRINEGLYTEDREISVNGKLETAEFRVCKVETVHPKNPQKTIQTHLWSFDCPKFNFYSSAVFEKKADAMLALDEACTIGFRTLPVKATMLAISPSTVK